MTQLILDGVVLPESKKGGYIAEKVPLSVDVEMITGRIVREMRGSVWRLEYQYGYFDDDTKNMVIAACERGLARPIQCGFLPQESSGELLHRNFFVTSFSRPVFMWSSQNRDGKPVPLWADFKVELREVSPSD